jgi:transcriptional regulator with XRE-family HTH domain
MADATTTLAGRYASQEYSRRGAGQRAHDVDVMVGQKIRIARISAGLSQERLAWNCGKTFQQIQKYERAMNRVSAGALALIAEATDRQPGWFFTTSEDVTAVKQDEGFNQALKLARKIADLSPAEQHALNRLVNTMRRQDEEED